MGSIERLDNAIEKGQELLPAGRRARYRLSEILVEEVSLVDRAANKRKFLVVKREPQGKDMGQPTDKMEHGECADPKDQEKPADESPSMKGMMMDKVAEAIERLVSVANKVKEAPEGADMSDDIAKELKAIVGMLSEASDKYPYPSPKSGEAAPEEEMEVETKKTEEQAADATPASDAPAVDQTAQALEKVAAAMTALTENVQKGFGDLAERLTKQAEAPKAEEPKAEEPKVEEAPAADPAAELAKKLEAVEAEKRELEAKLQKALEEPPARASQSTVAKSDGGDESPRVFPLYYNSSVHDPAVGA